MPQVRHLAVAIVVGIAALVVGASPARAGEYYRVSVTRIDQNLYREQMSRVLIVTQMCLELALGDDAVLIWDGPYSWDNKIVFSNGAACDVKGLYRG